MIKATFLSLGILALCSMVTVAYFQEIEATKTQIQADVEIWGDDLPRAIADENWLLVARMGRHFDLSRFSALGIRRHGRLIFSYPSEDAVGKCHEDFRRNLDLYGTHVGEVVACTTPGRNVMLALKSRFFQYFAMIFVVLSGIAATLPLLQYKRSLRRVLSALEQRARAQSKETPPFYKDHLAKRIIQLVDDIVSVQVDLQKQVDTLAENKKLGEMASQIAHDIRSPLSALNILLLSLPQIPEGSRVVVRGAINRIQDIASSLLDQARQSSKKKTKVGEPTDLISAIREIIEEKKVQSHPFSQLKFIEDIQVTGSSRAMVPPLEFRCTLSNLINNSIEAVEAETGEIRVAIREARDKIQVMISDNGKGISNDIILRVGERGLSEGKEGRDSGFGLGLYQAKQTIERAGGQFQIQSRAGLGTLITMTLWRC